ncbi:MAG: hypothetical protein WA728_24690 [Xanthobacteraceae bacterium]
MSIHEIILPHKKADYELHVHRKDGGWQRHLMRGELPKPGDTVPAILSREEAVMAKVAGLSELTLVDEEHSIVAAKVDADEV